MMKNIGGGFWPPPTIFLFAHIGFGDEVTASAGIKRLVAMYLEAILLKRTCLPGSFALHRRFEFGVCAFATQRHLNYSATTVASSSSSPKAIV